MTPPILFIIFNRPDTVQRVFEAIRQAQPRRLFVAADGPRKDCPDDIEKCAKTRAIIDQVDWECEVKTLFRDENLGCGLGPSTAISWFFEQVEQGIILEDDCLPHASFFTFCADLLERYKNDVRVQIISGMNYYPQPEAPFSYRLSTTAATWGWATWRNRWQNYEFDIRKISPRKLNRALKKYFREPQIRYYWVWVYCYMRITRYQGAWDYQWYFIRLLHGGLGITPKVNMIANIGFGEDSTHCHDINSQSANRPLSDIGVLVHPTTLSQDIFVDDHAMRQQGFTLKRHLLLLRFIYLFLKVRIFRQKHV